MHGAGVRPGLGHRAAAGARPGRPAPRGRCRPPGAPQRGQLLERLLGGRYITDARRAAAASATSCSPRRCRGGSCATSPGPCRCASRRSTRRRCAPSAARSALLAHGTKAAAGGCSRCRRTRPGRPWSVRTGRRYGRGCWTSSRPNWASRGAVRQCWKIRLCSSAELDDTGVPWVPRLGGRAPLGAELEHAACSGRWDRSHYAGRSEARMAILGAAAARGWRLADVRVGDRLRGVEGPGRAVRAALRARPAGPAPAPGVAKNDRQDLAGRKTYAIGTLATSVHAPRQANRPSQRSTD